MLIRAAAGCSSCASLAWLVLLQLLVVAAIILSFKFYCKFYCSCDPSFSRRPPHDRRTPAGTGFHAVPVSQHAVIIVYTFSVIPS